MAVLATAQAHRDRDQVLDLPLVAQALGALVVVLETIQAYQAQDPLVGLIWRWRF